MAADPITPEEEAWNLGGQVVTVFIASTAAAGAVAVNLDTYMPKIDVRLAHPVLMCAALQTETSTTGSQNFLPEYEMARGTAPDSGSEWVITDLDSVTLWRGADKNFILALTYVAYGVQKA